MDEHPAIFHDRHDLDVYEKIRDRLKRSGETVGTVTDGHLTDETAELMQFIDEKIADIRARLPKAGS